jgi:fructokinase
MTQHCPVICLGETLVDFVCERPVEKLADARTFTPFFGGSQANIAVGAARFGADSLMVGGAGDDPWGRWLRDTLAAEGVDTSRFSLVAGAQTPHAFVAVSSDGEPTFTFFGDAAVGVTAGMENVGALFAAPHGVFVFGSDSLIGAEEREATRRARDHALERGWDVVFDPNLRGPRWADGAVMLECARSMIAGCTIVKANVEEARALTGHSDADDTAQALRELGAGVAVVTLGADGIVVASGDRGAARVPALQATVVDATGAGDAVAAVLAAARALGAEQGDIHDVVALAAETAARVVEVRGALAGLPPAGEARALLQSTLHG